MDHFPSKTKFIFFSLPLAYPRHSTRIPFTLAKMYLRTDMTLFCEGDSTRDITPDSDGDIYYGGRRNGDLATGASGRKTQSRSMTQRVRQLVCRVPSGGNVYFVGDLATLKTSDNLTSADDALRVAADIERHGGRPAVGLLGVPLEWAARFGRSPRDLFDGCANLEVGSAMLSEFQDACSPPRPRDGRMRASSRRHALASRRRVNGTAARTCVLTRLAGELGLHGTPTAILKRVGVPSTQAGDDAPPQTSAIFGDGADDADAAPADCSNPRVYLDARTAVAAVKELAPSALPSRRAPSSPAPSQLAPLAPSPAERALPPIRRISR